MNELDDPTRLVVITGLSGSGKTVALRAMEDSGFYAIDNLPSRLIPELVDVLRETGQRRVAVSVDVRSAGSIQQLPDFLASVRDRGVALSLLFLDATDESLARRYAETRRPHPLAQPGQTMFRIQELIASERQMLTPLHELGQRLDTSHLNAHKLRAWVQAWLATEARGLAITLMSFGFKLGNPVDADFLFDVRSLPNPYYDSSLRPLTGRDTPVKQFLEAEPAVAATLADLYDFLHRQLPYFRLDNRAVVTIAIGCTGGQHRSVYVAEQLAQRLSREQALVGSADVRVWHRDAIDPS
jgi:RNase adapter protein RapZ